MMRGGVREAVVCGDVAFVVRERNGCGDVKGATRPEVLPATS